MAFEQSKYQNFFNIAKTLMERYGKTNVVLKRKEINQDRDLGSVDLVFYPAGQGTNFLDDNNRIGNKGVFFVFSDSNHVFDFDIGDYFEMSNKIYVINNVNPINPDSEFVIIYNCSLSIG